MMEQHLGFSEFERNLKKSKDKRTRVKKVLVASLMLTSMVDMFSLLVVFLLQNYSSTGELLFLNKSIKLPLAQYGQPVETGLLLAISEKEVNLDQKVVGTLNDVFKNPAKFVLELRKLIAKEGMINLQADKDLPSQKVSYVMGLAQQAGYHDFRITTAPGRVAVNVEGSAQ